MIFHQMTKQILFISPQLFSDSISLYNLYYSAHFFLTFKRNFIDFMHQNILAVLTFGIILEQTVSSCIVGKVGTMFR